MPTNSAGTTSTTTTLGYKNLSSYNHVYTPVASPATSAEAGYRKLVHQDIEETGRDNIWLRDEINRVLVQNELLRHRFRYLAFEDERRRQFEMERRVQEEEQRRLFEIEQRRREDAELERRRQEEDERRREEERRRLYEIEQNRRLEEERLRRLEEERRRREEEERRRREEEAERRRRQQEEEERRRNEKPVPKPPPRYRGKVPAIGDMLSVNVLKGEDLKRPGKLDKPDPYVMVGFDNQPPPYDHKTEVCKNTTDPVWDEVLNEMATPPYARGLAVEVYDKDHFSKDDFMGRGELDLRAEQNEMHAVELFDDDDHHVGRVYLRYHVRRGSAASSQAVPSGYSNLTFNVTEAKGLIDTDKFGKQDPYVTLHWGPDPAHFFKTSVEKGSNPHWSEGETGVRVPEGVPYVTVMVWDKDPGKDDFLGLCRVPLLPEPRGDHWLPLKVRENEPADDKLRKKGDLGQIRLKLDYNHVQGHGGPLSSTLVRPPSFAASPGPVPTRATVTVVSGEDLPKMDTFGKADPYVTVAVGTAVADDDHKTQVVHKDLDPVWNHDISMRVPEDTTHLTFTVYDHDKFNKSDFMGQAGFDVRAGNRRDMEYVLPLQPRPNNESDLKLMKKHGTLGKLKIRTHWYNPSATTIATPPPAPKPAPEPAPVTIPPPNDGMEVVDDY